MHPYAARPERTAGRFRRRTLAAPSASVATGPTQTSSPSNSSQPVLERAVANIAASSAREFLLRVGVVLALGELRSADHLAEPHEELRLERADGELAAVGGRVDPVAGQPAGEKARQRVAAEPVRDEPVRAVRHRDRQPRAAPGALALEQRRQHLATAPSAPAARSAGCSGGSPGAVSSSTPAQPR